MLTRIFSYIFGSQERRAYRERQLKDAYQRGRAYAVSVLYARPFDPNEFQDERVQELYASSNGSFNESPQEDEFDRGVRDVCREHEREYGAP